MRSTLLFIPALFSLLFSSSQAQADVYADASGQGLMEAVYRQHQQYPWVYEEQSMIMIDHRGNKNTRKLRRYSRVSESGHSDFLLLFDSPREVKGVALLASRDTTGETRQSFYLPALGPDFIHAVSDTSNQQQDNFLGTDYSIDNLVGEDLDDYRHVRAEDFSLGEIDYYVVDVFNADSNEQPARRHYIRKDNLFITRTDHYDDLGRLKKRQTQHDLTNVQGNMWRANMMMMESQVLNHRTIIKIDRRVFSADYVPAEVFTHEWLLANKEPAMLEPDND
ncbi:MAG: outer membrane lipoprotein-sorting protein [Gammaproteobacteria bacterium]|jgi:hypothetical protein|nr:outer membrane lipoprotein-sorting protein [Gammaproteobacteria bacterium]MBT4491884.1 outer membrane lipoprotein-sorting protein [Gammaproteobacteria bacterium]MBT7369623.1 outer membrane lipoprotein-sorting protein [Gammaproteobacteria bacterium]